MMAGVKQFDETEVLDRALDVFWRHGYEGASLTDLTTATGLGRGSLYGAFGDKEELFVRALARYGETIAAQALAPLADGDPREAIEAMFAIIIARMSDPRVPRGCLLANTTLACSQSRDVIARHVAAHLRAFESAIFDVVRRAQANGTLDPRTDARALARYFLTVAQGLAVLNKASPEDPAVLRDAVNIAMRVWKSR